MGPLHTIGSPGSVGVGIQYGRIGDASFFAVSLDDRIGDADREIAQIPISDISEAAYIILFVLKMSSGSIGLVLSPIVGLLYSSPK